MAKRKKTMLGKWFVMALCALAITMALAAGSAFAYLASEDSVENRVTVGAVETEITEEFPEPQVPAPGSGITKTVSIKNNGPNDCYVRVQLLFSDSVSEQLCSVNHPDTENWSFLDGWWYYGKILKSGENSSPVMDGLEISEEAGPDALNGFDIFVRQESVQAEGHSDAFSAFESPDKPEDSL